MNRKFLIISVIFSLFCLWQSHSMTAQVFKTQEEALTEAFASADTVIRSTLFLDSAQLETLQNMSKSKFHSKIITYYMGMEGEKVLGFAFFETQVVRTKKAVIMVTVSPDRAIKSVEVLAFMEPLDYLPSANWFELFRGKTLTPGLWPGKEIHAVTGATLSVRAFTLCVRRALAVQQFITGNDK